MRLDWLPQGWWTGAAWGVVLLAGALLIAQVAAIRRNETGLATARKHMTSVEGLLPHTPGELKLFLALSLSAGVGEEIVFRGYLLAYFDGLVGPTGAVLASTLMFGLGHAYEGAAGIVRTGIVGLLFAGAYVGTGNSCADAAARGDRRDQRDGRVPRAQTGDGSRRAAGLRASGGDGPRRSGTAPRADRGAAQEAGDCYWERY